MISLRLPPAFSRYRIGRNNPLAGLDLMRLVPLDLVIAALCVAAFLEISAQHPEQRPFSHLAAAVWDTLRPLGEWSGSSRPLLTEYERALLLTLCQTEMEMDPDISSRRLIHMAQRLGFADVLTSLDRPR